MQHLIQSHRQSFETLQLTCHETTSVRPTGKPRGPMTILNYPAPPTIWLTSYSIAAMADDNLSVSSLIDLAEQDPQQLQLHAGKIRLLEFIGNDCKHHKLFKDVIFSKLERVVIDASDENEERWLESYLQPALRAFVFYGGPISDTFLERLQKACPRLEELLIDNPRNLISPKGFLRFLDGANNLKRLAIMYGMDRVVNDDVFVALTTLPNLQSFESRDTITAELVSFAESQQIKKHVEARLFPRLDKLVCTANFDGLLGLLPHLPRLTYLEVTTVSSDASFTRSHNFLLGLPTSCPSMRILKLEYSMTEQASIDPSELVHLARGLPCMQHLEISGHHLKVPGLETHHIAKIAEALPNLRVLRLALQCSLTETALIELGQRCGGVMTNCELWGSHALQNIEGSGVFFPSLQELVLENLVPPTSDDTDSQAACVARLLKEMAPNLESFDVVAGDSFAALVGTTWKRLA